MTIRQTFTASDGVKLAYYVDDFTDPWTRPPTIVLLHSAMGNSQRFYSWIPALARHFRVVRLDLRGHGGSEVPPAEVPLSMDRFVQDVREVMDRVGVERAHLVANSAGGYLAQKLAIASPERVLGLCVVGSTPGLSPSALDWLPMIEREGLTPFLTRTIAMRFDLETTDPGMVRWFLEQTAENDPAYVVRFIGYMATQEWSAELPRIKAPTLVIYPGGETVGTANSYDTMRERIPDVTMLEVEHMPHNIADMVPQRCTDAILGFLGTKFGYPKV